MPLNADCGALILYGGLDLSYECYEQLNVEQPHGTCRTPLIGRVGSRHHLLIQLIDRWGDVV